MGLLRKNKRSIELNVPEKANKILNIILIVLVFIGLRVWHLAIIQHDVKVEESKRPQRKMVIEKADRAMICDRFGIPMALNKIQYNASIIYGELRQVPRSIWTKDAEGKKHKIPRRKEYIKELSEILGKELNLDPQRIEDCIHSKAAVFGNVPYTIKEGLTEKEYFRLKGLEKDWLGIRTEKVAKRFYPLGSVGADVIGYMGAISRQEYETITSEMRSLRTFLQQVEDGKSADVQSRQAIDVAESRLFELEALAYTLNDSVGKTGVEGFFDEKLRGYRGKKTFISDVKGNFLKELPGSQDAQTGQCLTLTISADLQSYAERLLAEYEEMAIARIGDFTKQGVIPPKQPWIKGGSVIVMDPNTGEVLTLASYPRYDPNDFIREPAFSDNEKKRWRLHRWLENEFYIGAIWDGKISLQRERFSIEKGAFYEEQDELSWKTYLDMILPNESGVKKSLQKMSNVAPLIDIQRKVDTFLSYFSGDSMISPTKIFDFVYQEGRSAGSIFSIKEKQHLQSCMISHEKQIQHIKKELDKYFYDIPLNYEKILLTDLCRLVINPSLIVKDVFDLISNQTIDEFREASAMLSNLQEGLKTIAEEVFHDNDFKTWQAAHFKEFLAQKRLEEEALKKAPKPYIEYLDHIEKELFKQFWLSHQWDLVNFFLTDKMLYSVDDLMPYYKHFSLVSDEMKKGAHQNLSWAPHYMRLKKIVSTFAPVLIAQYLPALRSFNTLERPLLGWYSGLRNQQGVQLEKHLAGAFYPTCGYGYARSQAFRQATTIGSVFKLVVAYEAVIQKYQQFMHTVKSSRDLNPLTIIDDKHKQYGQSNSWNVGYTQDGKPIPMFYRGGKLPRSDHGGIGKIDLIGALETSSNPYFALLAGDLLSDADDLCKAAGQFSYGERTGIDLSGEITGALPKDTTYNRSGLYAMSIGQHSLVGTPLQTAVMLSALANGGKILKPQIIKMANDKLMSRQVKREIFLPDVVRTLLMEGMHKVVVGDKGTARQIKKFGSQFDTQGMDMYYDVCEQIIGKTSTAEALERLSLDGSYGKLMCKHVWFAAISFEKSEITAQKFGKPELIVVVYLRFGDYGKQAAPLAAHMIKKWRELKNSPYAEK